jgi:SAM-dependent methyltransferase
MTAGWRQIKRAYAALTEAARSGADIGAPWAAFRAEVEAGTQTPPEHLTMQLKALRRVQGARPAAALKLLDHGCGGGLVAFYLAARGYRNVYGVNVNYPVDYLNRIVREALGAGEDRFLTTDGRALPFPDAFFDFVYSNQVLEHVSNALIDAYYAEEARVLKPGGGAYHEVPHLLVPYDSHSRVWFAHMLPRVLKPAAYGVLKSFERRQFIPHLGLSYTRFYEDLVHFRTPFYHRRQLRRHFGACEDLTLERLRAAHSFETYDPDGALGARLLVDRLVKAPLVGRALGAVLRNMVMLQTLAIKPGGPDRQAAE